MSRSVSAAAPSIETFLATDFMRLPAAALTACRQIDGRRLLLTGATGFFGKSILSLLAFLARGGARFEVTAISRDPAVFRRTHPNFEQASWLRWVVHDLQQPLPPLGPFDLLLHAATDTRAASHLDKLKVFETLMQGTQSVLAFASQCGVKRLLLCGSGAQYGAIAPSVATGICETTLQACDPTRSHSAYGEAKRASETLAAAYAEQFPWSVINTRCFAFVGPGLDLTGHFAIGNFLRQALAGETIRLSSAGRAVRSYLYSADLAVWLIHLLLHAPGGVAVNVGSGYAVTVAELARRVQAVVNPRVEVVTGADDTGGERSYYLPSVEQAMRLGLEVWTPLDMAILRTAEWSRGGLAA